MHSENPAAARERQIIRVSGQSLVVTGNIIKAGRALADISQLALAKAAGIPTQTISRMGDLAPSRS